MIPADWVWTLPDGLAGLLARIRHRDRGDGCWAKIDDLRGVQSRRSTTKRLAELEQMGAITVQRNPGERNIVRVVTDWRAEAPLPANKPRTKRAAPTKEQLSWSQGHWQPPAKAKEKVKAKAKAKAKAPAVAEVPTSKTWAAYSSAYFARYGVAPVRNASVNSKIASLVKRLGEEAPAVAAYYLSRRDAFYIRASHSVGPLLKDCEALRTQWLTGEAVTPSVARDRERTASNPAAAYAADLRRREQK